MAYRWQSRDSSPVGNDGEDGQGSSEEGKGCPCHVRVSKLSFIVVLQTVKPSHVTQCKEKNALTFVLSSLLFTATVLESLFEEYHSSSAALSQQSSEITKQPLCFRSCRPITNKLFVVCDWYSLKRPSSTVAVNSSELNTKVSAFSLVFFIPARQNAFSCLLLRHSWDWTALPLFMPYGSSHHYGGRFLHLGAVTTQG